MNTQQLEEEFNNTKKLIKQHLEAIKTYINNIEDCKKQVDSLNTRLGEIQAAYQQLTSQNKDIKNEK